MAKKKKLAPQRKTFMRKALVQYELGQVVHRIQQRIDYLRTVDGDQSGRINVLEQYQLLAMRAKIK